MTTFSIPVTQVRQRYDATTKLITTTAATPVTLELVGSLDLALQVKGGHRDMSTKPVAGAIYDMRVDGKQLTVSEFYGNDVVLKNGAIIQRIIIKGTVEGEGVRTLFLAVGDNNPTNLANPTAESLTAYSRQIEAYHPLTLPGFTSAAGFSPGLLPGATRSDADVIHLAEGSKVSSGLGDDTIYGSDGTDIILSGPGNDFVKPGGNSRYDLVDTGSGNDVIDLTGQTGPDAYSNITNTYLRGGISVTLNGIEDSLVINKGGEGVTKVIGASTALESRGLRIEGTETADHYSVLTLPEQSINLRPLGGPDVIHIHGNSQVQLSYWSFSADRGVTADLQQGKIIDSSGHTDSVTGTVASFSGSPKADQIVGSMASEVINGNGGDDTILGSGGADTLDGDDGNDVLNGDDGAQINAAGQIWRLYQATLDRAPDPQGFASWTGKILAGESLKSIAQGFVGSSEFQAKYGATSDSGFVNLLYRNVLGRDPDAAGMDGWLKSMAGGLSRLDVVLGFSESAEFQRDSAAAATASASEISRSAWADDVYRLYRATLNRDPDAKGFSAWLDTLIEGTPFATVIEGFLTSAEFTTKFDTDSPEKFVTLLYENVLGRSPDQAGLSAWIKNFDDGMTRAQAVIGFFNSAEFIAKTKPGFAKFMRAKALDDTLIGDGGTNISTGGFGADSFVLTKGESLTVTDFEPWDILSLKEFGYLSNTAALSAVQQVGGDAVLRVDGTTTVTLKGTDLSDLSADNFEIA